MDDGNPRIVEYCYSPWLITPGVFGITMIVIISLHLAVRKRGEQYLEASVEERTDRRAVFRGVCGPHGTPQCAWKEIRQTHVTEWGGIS